MRKYFALMLAVLIPLFLTACVEDLFEEPRAEKPAIYLYPNGEACDKKPVSYLSSEEELRVSVKLYYNGTLTSTYPAYNDGWEVIAKPDGTLVDPDTGRAYYCLFWEGVGEADYDFSRGFSVAGEDTAAFLEDALAKLGLSAREANEFIIYWLPRMEQNPYNLIAFQTDRYTENAVLTVEPTPDTVIRVFMAWKAMDRTIDIEPQTLTSPERTGFTVVEWGGSEVK